MRRWVLAGWFLWNGGGLAARGDEMRNTPAHNDETNSTVITSKRLSFDQRKRIAIFEEHVVVTDPQLNITSDGLRVLFSEDQKVVSLEAQGNVTIQQGDTKATGENATYDVKEAKIVLSGHPLIQRGRDRLSAQTITFWRNSNRILCEPNARLIVRSETDVFTDAITKE